MGGFCLLCFVHEADDDTVVENVESSQSSQCVSFFMSKLYIFCSDNNNDCFAYV